jgi:adenylate kinase family enzyme
MPDGARSAPVKIAILGYSGSGKSTLAKKLSELYGVPVLYLDTVQFLPGWELRDREEARSLVRDFMQSNQSWVIDGNYRSFLQPERLEQADVILFLNFPRFVCLWRAFSRDFRNKNTSRESMANGCIEKIDAEFVWWILHQGRTKAIRQRYCGMVADYRDKTHIFKNQRQVDAYMRQETAALSK